jgi:hypothetical protein
VVSPKPIKSAITGADSEAVDYPAVLSPYGSSEMKGVKAAKEQLTDYVKRFPNAKVVLMGCSEVRMKKSFNSTCIFGWHVS